MIGDRPITLLLTRDQPDDTPDLWYSFDDTGRYDAATNRFRYARQVLEDDGSEGDVVRFVARDEQTGEASKHFTGQFDPEGGLRGEWRQESTDVVRPFRLEPLTVLRQGRDPRFAIRMAVSQELKDAARADSSVAAILEIEGEDPIPLSGEGGLVVEPLTDCGPIPFDVAVRRLVGTPDLYLIETEDRGGWGLTDPRYLFFVKPGALESPLLLAAEVFRRSTSVGLGWDCEDDSLRYSYSDGVLTLVDEKDQTREIAPERYGMGSCITVDRTLTVSRFEVRTAGVWLDKWVEVPGDDPGDCHEEDQEEARQRNEALMAAPPGWVVPPLKPWLFDDGLSGWLLVPRDPDARGLRINQRPDDPALKILTVNDTRIGDRTTPLKAEHYNGPDTPLRAACWIYNRTETPGRFQQRTYPPLPLSHGFRLPPAAADDIPAAEVMALVEFAYDDGSGPVWRSDRLEASWSKAGTALVMRQNGQPFMLFDGEGCYHRDLKESGRWGRPWSDVRYDELFGPSADAKAGDRPESIPAENTTADGQAVLQTP
ncbi:hypothetical protein [Thermochromatium tepidum]|uniref:Uncharacterized protein n=1 Tax=Thermochromatium tepidum ATCC 43061 TaxID=316276 RepID=A0A6I6E391_THETI|nr:hypothetical protein [Thermochromatium tepidum]QGU32202.1 hypothetical protein E6P07_03890 [Thermochromatium tepidum ATCC 43061]